MDLSAFYTQFREETNDNIQVIASGLLALERAPEDRATLDAIFRAAHTVKGSARLLGFQAVSQLAHAMESLLGALRAGALPLSQPISDLLLQANDRLLALATAASQGQPVSAPSELIERLERLAGGDVREPAAAPAPASSAPEGAEPSVPSETETPPAVSAAGAAPVPEVVSAAAPAPPSAATGVAAATVVQKPAAAQGNGAEPAAGGRAARGTVRVRVDRLDRLVAVAGELAVERQADGEHLEALQALLVLTAHQQRALQQALAEVASLNLPLRERQRILRRLDDFHARADEIARRLRSAHAGFARRAAARGALVDELEAEVFAARLVPVATVLATIPRAVRELARSLGRQVELELRGEETEADRKVLDALAEPLLHMVRNAIDHGLEPPEERVQAGKPPTGRLTIAAEAEHGQLRVTVADDGRGIDPQAIRAAAVRKGIVDAATAAGLSDADAIDLIFAPGFSTSAIITDVSGRGVGMDVVRARISELGGQVLVESQLGRGTAITLLLPISMMTSQVLLVETAGQRWALPANACRGALRLERCDIHRLEGQPLLQIDGRNVPLYMLAQLLERPTEERAWDAQSHVVLLGASRPIAVAVEQLLDKQEVVIKPLGTLLDGHPLAMGVAPLADGTLAVVLSTQGLIDRARRVKASGAPGGAARTTGRLLVADDSFTTRELLRSILQSAGYDVTTAVDGQDALDRLRADPGFNLVISDVEMPRLDGFALTRSIRADAALQDVPVVLVTSLHSDEHKRQGLAAGAQAYIVKSQFDQSNLLAVVRDLLAF